jgi:hypothetical protein
MREGWSNFGFLGHPTKYELTRILLHQTSLILALVQGEVPYVIVFCPPPDPSQLTHHRYMFQLSLRTTLLSSRSTNILSNWDSGTLRAMRTLIGSGPIPILDLTLLSYVSLLTPQSPSRMLKRRWKLEATPQNS